MGKINDKTKYPYDVNLSLDDFVIGSDADNVDFTRNYALSGIFSTFRAALDLASISYKYSDGVTDATIDENDKGFFTANSDSAAAVSSINLNQKDLNNIDIAPILDVISAQPTSFILRIFKPSVTGQVFYFAVTNITDNLDDTYTLTVDNFVGGNTLQDGTTYSFVFDLAGIPSIYTEQDPVFTASPAFMIGNPDISNWNTAFGWGNHALAGYLTTGDLTGTGLVNSSGTGKSFVTNNSGNWNTAFSWGDHSVAGYLTSYTETDPVFTASPAFGITVPDIGTWDLAYSWGDHSIEGYLTSETDPVFTASDVFSVTTAKISTWDSAYQWGNHASVGYLTAELNNLSSAVTWVNVPNANITQASVTQHQTALSITESQISDLGSYLTSVSFADLTGKPTTISDYGITDAYTKSEADGKYLLNTTDTLTGTLTIDSNESMKHIGSGAGNANVSFYSIYEADGTTRQAYIGFPTSLDDDLYFYNQVGDASLRVLGEGGSSAFRAYWTGGNGILWHQGNLSNPINLNTGFTWTGIGDSNARFQTSQNGGTSAAQAKAALEVYAFSSNDAFMAFHISGQYAVNFGLDSVTNDLFVGGWSMGNNSYKIWHEGNDGAGSGLDADTLDGQQSSGFVRTNASSTVGNHSIRFEGSTLWAVSSADDAHQRVDARDEGAEARMHWYGVNTTSGTSNAKHAFFDGSTYVDFTAQNGGISIGGDIKANEFNVEDKIKLTDSNDRSGLLQSYPLTAEPWAGFQIRDNPSNQYWSLMGDDNNVGVYDDTNNKWVWLYYENSRLNLYHNGNVKLETASGGVIITGTATATNFILSSDRRLKENIQDLDIPHIPTAWKSFTMGEDSQIRYGVIAQELELTNPEFVRTDDEGMKSVAYIDLLVAKMAEKDNQIKRLEQRLERLEKLIG